MARRNNPEDNLADALAKGIIVDDQDRWLLEWGVWSIIGRGYPCITIPSNNDHGRTTAYLHHYIVGVPWSMDEEVDHIDRDPLNNSRSNLRYVSHRTNMLNTRNGDNPLHNIRERPWSDGTVSYQLRMYVNGAYRHKTFAAIEEALEARTQWENE